MIQVSLNRVGVMQGRLSPRPPGALQAFPRDSWPDELPRARTLGADFLEWIFDANAENPLASAEGRSRIRALSAAESMPIRSVCADYFMVHPLCAPDPRAAEASANVLRALVASAHEIGAVRILLPLLESANIDTPERRERTLRGIRHCLPALDASGIVLGLEMEIAGSRYAEFIHDARHPLVRAYYDTGNSTASGFDIEHDVRTLLDVLEAVHVKDREIAGPSRKLGQGATNFPGLFRSLQRAGFSGDFLLQHYFDDPERDAAYALDFVRRGLAAARSEAA